MLIEENGITAKKLTIEAGLSTGSITDWKKGDYNPSYGAIVKIAKYFNVSEEYLQCKTDNPSPPRRDEDDEIWELRREMSERSEMKTLFSLSKNAKKEDIEFINRMLKNMQGGNNE